MFWNFTFEVWRTLCFQRKDSVISSPVSVSASFFLCFLWTCSCKSVIDSQCELTVLWTVIVYIQMKRSQSFAPNSGTVTFFTEWQDVQCLRLTLTALRTLHYSTVCVPPQHDTLELQLVLQLAWMQLCVSLKELRKRALSLSQMMLDCTEWMQNDTVMLNRFIWVNGMFVIHSLDQGYDLGKSWVSCAFWYQVVLLSKDSIWAMCIWNKNMSYEHKWCLYLNYIIKICINCKYIK